MSFKIGDEVVILYSEGYGYKVTLEGLTGIIIEIRKHSGQFPYMVKFNDGFTEVFTDEELRMLTKLERALK